MTLEERISSVMSEVLGDYMAQNGVKTGNTALDLEVKWVGLVQEMSDLMTEITELNKPSKVQVGLPQVYVLDMLAAMKAIKKHKLYSLMGYEEDEEWKVDEIINSFLEPLSMVEDDEEVVIDFYN